MFLPSLADGTAVADAFVLPASAVQRLTSRPVEDVHLLRDEAANLAWAVGAVGRAGRRGAARRTELPAQPSPPSTGPLRYRLGGSVPPNWFPLVPTRTASGDVPELVVRQMADDPQVPTGTLLRLGAAFDDDRIPREGQRVVQEHVLVRWKDGSTHLWAAPPGHDRPRRGQQRPRLRRRRRRRARHEGSVHRSLISGNWACHAVGAEQCRWYGLFEGLALHAAVARRAWMLRSPNCNVYLDDLRWDRPDLDCEPQQARGIPRNLQLDETVMSCPGEGCTVRVKVAPEVALSR